MAFASRQLSRASGSATLNVYTHLFGHAEHAATVMNASPSIADSATVQVGAMKRPFVLVGLALALALVFATGGLSSPGAPVLRSVSEADGHVIVTFTLALDLVPGQVLVATSRLTSAGLIPASSVKLREAMRTSPDPATGVARWRTRKTVPAGKYYIEVSGVETGGVTDCRPRRPNCLMRWSNARRIVIS